MAQIFQMSPQLANLIAAGEVVERPGSVVKELVENAIDAGARHITVEVRHGGVSYMRVTDDGSGILPEDVRTAFLRHATSKVRRESDLLAIGTLGFRGEALAAISAVARVDLFTRTQGRTEGTQITLEGGRETGYGETGCPVGTTVVIRDLFFNVPARAKFLKKDATEGAYVEQVVTQIAISRPQVAFQLIKDGRECLSTPGDGKMLSAIYAAGGRDLAGRMLALLGTVGEIGVSGYISPPDVTRAQRNQQNFFINGRWVRSRLLTAALEEGYRGRLMTGRYPLCYLQLELHPASLDVNVHPAKLEVKFSREKEVFSAVYRSVVSALEGNDDLARLKAPAARTIPPEERITGEQQSLPEEKAPGPRPIPTLPETFRSTQQRVASGASPVYHTGGEQAVSAPAKAQPAPGAVRPAAPPYATSRRTAVLRPEVVDEEEEPVPPPAAPPPQPEKAAPPAPSQEPAKTAPAPKEGVRLVGELFHTYIVAEDSDGLWLIDKHAAHERMLFDQLKARGEDRSAQLLLEPLTVTLAPGEKAACLEKRALLERAGFVLEDFGPGGLLVRGAPMYLEPGDIPFVLSDMAGRLLTFRGGENELLEDLLKSVACKAAVKAGMITDPAELQLFAEKVLAGDGVRSCPHGRPCVTYVSRYQLEKLFKRVL